MIRAGHDRVYTLADLARLEGKSLGTYRNRKLNKRPGHPAPVSSHTAKTLLYDAGQVDAFLAGEPVPALPTADDPADLLDQHEAAALAGVSARSWETYRHQPGLAEHRQEVAGVEHWPRAAVTAWQAQRPGRGAGGGRPAAARDALPRDQVVPKTAQLLEAQPDISAAAVSEQLGIHATTAHRALTEARTARVYELLQADPDLSERDVVARLGYRPRTAHSALDAARARLRAQRAQQAD